MWNNSNFEGNHEIGIVSVLKGFFSQENLLMSGLTCVISLFRAYFSCIVLHVFIKTSHCNPDARLLLFPISKGINWVADDSPSDASLPVYICDAIISRVQPQIILKLN